MSAFNWITIEDVCPNCKKNSSIKCQTHIASSYDGDNKGRFCDRQYTLLEKFVWWDENSPKFSEWRVNGKINGPTNGVEDFEACYSTCETCKASIYVVFRFENLRAIEIQSLGLESDWPSMFFK